MMRSPGGDDVLPDKLYTNRPGGACSSFSRLSTHRATHTQCESGRGTEQARWNGLGLFGRTRRFPRGPVRGGPFSFARARARGVSVENGKNGNVRLEGEERRGDCKEGTCCVTRDREFTSRSLCSSSWSRSAKVT